MPKLVAYTAIGLTVVSVVCLVTLPVLHEKRNDEIKDYGTSQYAVLIDAGSSGSTLSVYSWDRNTRLDSGSGVVSQVGGACVNKSALGISEYAVPEDAAQSLVGCLQEALRLVPSTHYPSTPLYLAATAGMRLLRENNASHSDAILNSISELFQTYPFEFDENKEKHARIITGAEEGIFGWMTVNYLLGMIDPYKNPTPGSTVGALDLGGASTQITFVPQDSDEFDNSSLFYHNISAYQREYYTYSYSFLCWGLNEARRRYLSQLVESHNYSPEMDDPCGLAGDMVNVTGDYLWLAPCSSGPEAIDAWGSAIHVPTLPELVSSSYKQPQQLASADEAVFLLRGTGNSSGCRQLVDNLFPQTGCSYPTCSFNGVYQPRLSGSDFMAFSGYYYQAEPTNLTGRVMLGDLVNATDAVCNMTLEQVLRLPGLRPEFANRYCFTIKYAASLLTDGFGFPPSMVIDFRADVNGTDTGWALGYVISASNIIPVDFGPSEFLNDTSLTIVIAVFCVLAGMALPVLACRYRRHQRERAGFVRLRDKPESGEYGAM